MKKEQGNVENVVEGQAKPDLLDVLTSVQEVNIPYLANKMLDYREPYTHTEIHNPTAMTACDMAEEYFKELKIDRLIRSFRVWLRINYIAYLRQRAKEMAEILRSGWEQEQKNLTWRETLLGR